MRGIKRMIRDEEAMTIIGGCLGCIAGCGVCSICFAPIGGLYGLRMDMRYLSGILVRCTDSFMGPIFY